MHVRTLLNAKYLSSLALAVGLVSAGCGGDDGSGSDVPADGVATVGDVVIAKTAYDQMLPSTRIANPDSQQAKIAAMQILLQREWTKQEAGDQDIAVTDAAVRKALAEQRAQFFKKESQYRSYLRKTKRSEKDLYAGMQQKLLMDKLTARAVRESPPIDDERVAKYYEQNRKEFALPERREVHTLIAKTKADAAAAKQAVADGMSWEKATKTYALKASVTKDSAKARELSETGVKPLDKALAPTKAGDRIVVKTQYGWILVGVERVLPSQQRSLKETEAEIRARLIGSRREDAINAYIQDFQEEYKEKSTCAAAYKVAECSNGPDENPQPKAPESQRPSPDNPGEGADK